MKNYFAFVFLFISSILYSQKNITLSGIVRDSSTQTILPYVNVILKAQKDSTFITGGISDEEGLFKLTTVPGNYLIEFSFIGYKKTTTTITVGTLSEFLDLGKFDLPSDTTLNEVVISEKQDEAGGKLDKKTFSVEEIVSQSGGTVLDILKTLPGVTISSDGKVLLRGNDKVVILIDGKQTALTGFGNQTGLDNIPASAVERVEIINNPSSKYDANGNAGVINIILKKEKNEGFNGKAGLATGLGALWIKKENFPGIRPQYQCTPKINPSLSLNYRKSKYNVFLQADYLYTQTLNKNEFVVRTYENGDIINQQTKRNRNTGILTTTAGIDYYINVNNSFTISALFSSEKIIDRGDQPFFNNDFSEQRRLWQFLEDELKTTVTASASWHHKFKQPGRVLQTAFNYTFHREDEKYFFTNIMPTYTGYDAFKLLSDERVGDFTLDYTQPLKSGHFEAGVKLRKRFIPTNMLFFPGFNSPLDTNAGGWANYNELIPAVYGNYIYERGKIELEAGLRIEYVKLEYTVNPEHNTYASNGYDYIQPFPNTRLTYKLNDLNRISFFYTRRVDRPNEVDIRIFPKYDDAEIIKVGNPALRPQFTNSFEIGYKTSWDAGYFYSAAYHKIMDATITRISSTAPNSNLIYTIFQNAGRSYNTGIEIMVSQKIKKWATLNVNLNGYINTINAFTVENLYPVPNTFSAEHQEAFSGNAKFNGIFQLPMKFALQVTAIYLAPDIIPQGKTGARFSLDFGIKRSIQNGKGELFLNASDIANTMQTRKEIKGNGFSYISTDYYETQVIRLGYNLKF